MPKICTLFRNVTIHLIVKYAGNKLQLPKKGPSDLKNNAFKI